MRIPQEIVVNPATVSYEELRQQSETCPSTGFFGVSAHLQEVVDLAADMHNRAEQFSYTSVGCSYGAELDSVASLLLARNIRAASLLGIDVDPRVLDQAKQGQYAAHDYSPLFDFWDMRRMRKLGFTTTKTPDRGLLIDARDIRAQHEVGFEQVDLCDKPLSAFGQNLITCHNVLPHIAQQDPQRARAMADRLCALVARCGILSIASEPAWFNKQFDDPEVPSYRYFHGRVTTTMRNQYNMEVALRDSEGNVIALRKKE